MNFIKKIKEPGFVYDLFLKFMKTLFIVVCTIATFIWIGKLSCEPIVLNTLESIVKFNITWALLTFIFMGIMLALSYLIMHTIMFIVFLINELINKFKKNKKEKLVEQEEESK